MNKPNPRAPGVSSRAEEIGEAGSTSATAVGAAVGAAAEAGRSESDRGRRRYDNTRRRELAARNRAAVHRAAFELFSQQGYASTTFARIAQQAGVSVETVQKMGAKSALLDGAKVYAVFDVDELDVIEDADFMRSVAAQESFEAAVEVLVDFYSASNRRAAGFWQTWRAAALDDAGAARAWSEEMASARRAFADGITYAITRGWLRTDLSHHELTATLWLLASAETYTRLTADSGLDHPAYRGWLRRSLLEQLGPPRS